MLRALTAKVVPSLFAGLRSRRASEKAELQRLRHLPRRQPAVTHLFGHPFEILDGPSFAHLYRAFFKQQLHRFKAATDRPYIIDCGAHIGVSVTWWKTLHPNARVLAFEPDPAIFRVLEKNCAHFRDVELVNAAVWDQEGERPFAAKGNEGGHMAEFAPADASLIRSVRCVRLRPFLAEPCDFLKLDVEGAEAGIIRDCADRLRQVDRAFIEFHSFVGRPQLLAQTVSLLEAAGFRLHVHTELPSPRPFEELLVLNDKDLRLDLFCYRETNQPAQTIVT